MRERKSVEPMTRGQAQSLVLDHANRIYKEKVEDGERWHSTREGMEHKRLGVYQEIGDLIVNKDLPQVEVDELVGKILLREWWPMSQKLATDFLKEHDILKDYLKDEDKYHPDVFKEVVWMFPQSTDILKKRYSSILDNYKKTKKYSGYEFESVELFLVDGLDFNDEERKIIAKSWLAGYFKNGKEVTLARFYTPSKEQVDNLVLSMLHEMFGFKKEDFKEVAQDTLNNIGINGESDSLTFFSINKLLDNLKTSPLVETENLDFSNLNIHKFVELLEFVRKRSRVRFHDDPDHSREGVVSLYASKWWCTEMETKTPNTFAKELDKLSEETFFQTIDNCLFEEVRELGTKLNISHLEINEALEQAQSSVEITNEVKELIRVRDEKYELEQKLERERESSELNGKLEEERIKYQKDLALALEMLQK